MRVNYLLLQLTITTVNDVAWAPNMGRSYHLIASAGQDHHQQLKVSPTKRIFAAFILHASMLCQIRYRSTGC